MATANATNANAAPVASTPTPAEEPRRGSALVRFLRDHGLWAIGLFLAALGAKFWMLHNFGDPLPFMDQWDGEGADIYVPWLEGHLKLADLFIAHNEHRIFLTRLWDLILLRLNGQWDDLLQPVINAIIHAAGFTGLGVLLARWMGRQRWPYIWLLLALALLPPFAWENTLAGFQSQFYFLAIASLVAIWGLALAEPFSWRWWLGLVSGVLALFTMASGFMAAVTAAGLVILNVLKYPQKWRRALPTLAVCAVLAVAGMFIKADVPRHNAIKAHSAGEFIHAFARNLGWPCVDQPLAAIVNIIPLALLAFMHFRSREEQGSESLAERMVLGIGLWALLQSLATAYARGVGGGPPASRYMDSLSLVMVANGLAIVLLATRHAQRLWRPPVVFAGFVVWGIICFSGLWDQTETAWHKTLPTWAFCRDGRRATTRAFMITNNPKVLTDAPPYWLPFPYLDQLAGLLRHPGIRGILPACGRDPIQISPAAADASDAKSFITNGLLTASSSPTLEVCWGSYTDIGPRARGTFESQPLPKTKWPFLEIPVIGELGAPGLSLQLVDLATGKVTPVIPAHPSAVEWQTVHVKAPAGPFKLVARDESDTAWFAFQEPREMARLSYWAMWTVAGWKWFLSAGLGLTLVAFGCFVSSLAAKKKTGV